MIPTRTSLMTWTIVSAEPALLEPIRCSSRARISAAKDQNRYAASSAAADAARKRMSLLVERGRAIRVICVSSMAKSRRKQIDQYKEQRQNRHDNCGQPRGNIIERAVHVAAHHLAIVHESEDGEQHDRQQQAIDHLRHQQHADQWQVRNYRYCRTDRHQESKRSEKDRRFTKTTRNAFFKSERLADRIGRG